MNPAALTDAHRRANAQLTDRFDQAASIGSIEWCAAAVQEKEFLRDLLAELVRQTRPPTPVVGTEIEITGQLRAEPRPPRHTTPGLELRRNHPARLPQRHRGQPVTRFIPIDAERLAIGCIFSAASYSADAGIRVATRVHATGLNPEHFAIASHGELYQSSCNSRTPGVPVDPVSVAAEIDREHGDKHLIDGSGSLRTRYQRSAPQTGTHASLSTQLSSMRSRSGGRHDGSHRARRHPPDPLPVQRPPGVRSRPASASTTGSI